MGLSIAGAASVFFVGAIVMGIMLYGAIDQSVNSFLDASSDMVERDNNTVNSGIEILSCTYNYSADLLSVEVKNTGGVSLPLGGFNLIVGGDIYSPSDFIISVDGITGLSDLPPGSICYINISGHAPSFDENNSGEVILESDNGLGSPTDISVGDGEYIHVLDSGAVRVFSRSGTYLFSITGHLTDPVNITFSNGMLYVLDTGRIDVFNKNGEYLNSITTNMSGAVPSNIWASGWRLYLANSTGGVVVMDANGTYIKTLRENITNATDVFVSDNIYVIDDRRDIDVFSLSGTYLNTFSNTHLTSPISISGDGQAVQSPCLYVSNASGDIIVLNESGDYVETISSGLGTDVWGVDSSESIFAVDRANGIVGLTRGCSVWVFDAYGGSDMVEV